MDFGSMGATALGMATGLLTNGIVFVGAIILIFIAIIFNLKKRKAKKFITPCIEVMYKGNGKVALRSTIGGWFKLRTTLFGLIDWKGPEVFKILDKRIVHNITSKDYQQINGKNGLLIMRKKDDPNILVPIRDVYFDKETRTLINSIAPSSLRNVSLDIVYEAQKETMGWIDKYLPYAIIVFCCILLLISIIIISQMNSTAIKEGKDLIIKAGEVCKSVAASSSAPLFLFFRRRKL